MNIAERIYETVKTLPEQTACEVLHFAESLKAKQAEESAIAVIECKFDINTKKNLKETFVQAKSYALRLQASILALAARRGLWIFRQNNDGFSIDYTRFR